MLTLPCCVRILEVFFIAFCSVIDVQPNPNMLIIEVLMSKLGENWNYLLLFSMSSCPE